MSKRITTLLLVGAVALFGYSDTDMDGVDDHIDQCPNTPLTDIVDAKGCSIRSVIVENHFDIVAGLAYSQYNYRLNTESDTWTTSLQLDWYRNDFTLQLSTSYYKTDADNFDDKGMNDTSLTAYYRFDQLAWAPRLTIQVGAGLVFPTYDTEFGNNKTDYLGALSLNYDIQNVSIFGGYTYTYVGDDDVTYTGTDGNLYDIRYQNTNAFNVGAGYHVSPKLYASLSYYRADSIYEGVDDIENISLYGFYSIDTHWFTTASYAYGLSDQTSDNYFSLRIGYYF